MWRQGLEVVDQRPTRHCFELTALMIGESVPPVEVCDGCDPQAEREPMWQAVLTRHVRVPVGLDEVSQCPHSIIPEMI